MNIFIKYISNDIDKIEKFNNGDWIDLRSSEDIEMNQGDSCMIPLGVAMKLPDGYEAIVAPRSSTFGKYGIIQTNSIGVIDNSYCGDNDEWKMPVYATRHTVIPKNTRICQFRVLGNQERLTFNEVEQLLDSDRGGFGSTGES